MAPVIGSMMMEQPASNAAEETMTNGRSAGTVTLLTRKNRENVAANACWLKMLYGSLHIIGKFNVLLCATSHAWRIHCHVWL
jgi:hypothetical protein